MKIKVTTRGFKAVDAKLARLVRESVEIPLSAVTTAVSVLASAAEAAAPGKVSEQISSSVRVDGNQVTGVAGLPRAPRPGEGRSGPYGYFPDQGTKHIRPQHFIGRALTAAVPTAMQAAKNAGYRTAQRISRSKGGV